MKKEIVLYSVLTAVFLALFVAALFVAGIRDAHSPLFSIAAFFVEYNYVVWLLGGATLVFGGNTAATLIKYKRYGDED